MRIAVVHHPDSSASLTEVRQSAPPDVEVSILFRGAVAERHPRLVEVSRLVFPTSVCSEDPDDVDLSDLDAVLTFADQEVEYTDALRSRLWGPEHAVSAPWDKAVQRQTFSERGLSTLKFGLARSRSELAGIADTVGFPLMVKPTRGAGGHGVYRVESPGGLDWAIEHATSWPVLVEEAIPAIGGHPCHGWMASLFSVEMESDARGEHSPIAVFGKIPVERPPGSVAGVNNVRVCGDVLPSGLTAEDENLLVSTTAQALAALGVTRRVTHTELIMTPSGPEIVEINGRMGGFLARVLRKVSEVDLVEVTIQAALGRRAAADRATSGVAAGYFPSGPVTSGSVRSKVTVRDMRALPNVVLVERHARHGLPWSEADFRMANVVLSGADHDDLGRALHATKAALDSLYADDLGRVSE